MAEFFRPLCHRGARKLDGTAPTQPISTDSRLHNFLKQRLGNQSVEAMLIVFYDADRHYLSDEEIGWGGISTIEVDLTLLLRQALMIGASSFLMAHNHPSGNCQPSELDICATRRVAHAANLVGLQVLDHLVVTQNECYSMRAGAIV